MENPEYKPLKVFVIDPDDSYSDKISSIISEELGMRTVVRSSTLLDNLRPQLEAFHPDVVIMETYWEGVLQVDLIKQLLTIPPKAEIVGLASNPNFYDVLSLMKLGVCDFVKKDNEFDGRLADSILDLFQRIQYHSNLDKLRDDILNPSAFPIVLFKASESGIEAICRDFQVFPESLDVPLNQMIQTIGVSILVSVGQGHNYPEGCYSLPAASSKSYELLVFTFMVQDPDAIDPRLRTGYFQLVIFVNKMMTNLLPSASELAYLIPIIKSHFPTRRSMTLDNLSRLKAELMEEIKLIKKDH